MSGRLLIIKNRDFKNKDFTGWETISKTWIGGGGLDCGPIEAWFIIHYDRILIFATTVIKEAQ